MLAPTSLLAPVAPPPTGPASHSSTGTSTLAGETATRANASPAQPPRADAESKSETPAAPRTDTVTLSATHDRPAVTAPLPVYAEIWKDGVKIAEIDNHGGVVSFAGPVAAAPPGGAAGGTLQAAIRAAQVAQSVGGEIRINGVTVDAGTMRMRAQLATTYGHSR